MRGDEHSNPGDRPGRIDLERGIARLGEPIRAFDLARSLARPVARLFRTSAAQPITSTATLPKVPRTRSGQASANLRPVRSVRRSMRPWGHPILDVTPAAEKSASVSSVSGAPKARRACITRPTLSGVGSTQTSRSPVARGRPWTASASAPTTRNRTSASMTGRNRSTTSRLIKPPSEDPLFLAERPDVGEAFSARGFDPELEIVAWSAAAVAAVAVDRHSPPSRAFCRRARDYLPGLECSRLTRL